MGTTKESVKSFLQRFPLLFRFLRSIVRRIRGIKARAGTQSFKSRWDGASSLGIKEWKKGERSFDKSRLLAIDKPKEESDKLDEAIEHYTRAIETGSEIADWYVCRGRAKNRRGMFNDETKSDFQKAIELSDGKNLFCFNEYMSFLWETEGVSPEMMELFTRAIERSSIVSPNILARYASGLLDIGDTDGAHHYYQKAKALSRKSVEHFLPLAALATERSQHPDNMEKKDALLYRYLKENEGKLEQLLKANSNSIAVVGNSPKELGTGKGKIIDEHELVVRFNEYSIDPPYDRDYGVKSNIWVRSIGNSVAHRDMSEFKLVLFSGINLPSRYRDWNMVRFYTKRGIPVALFPTDIQYELVEKIKAVPSSGICICYMLHKMIGPLDRNSVFGFGFTDHLGKDATAQHYYDAKPPSGRHNWPGEKALFSTLLKMDLLE